MNERTTMFSAGTAGLVFFAASLFDTAADPPEGATPASLRRWYETHLGEIGLSVTAGAVSLAALLVLVTALVVLLREQRLYAVLAAGAGLLTAVWIWMTAAVAMIPIGMADDRRLDGVSDTAVLTIDQFSRLGETVGDLGAVPRGLFLLAVSLAGLRTRVLPRWLAWFGLLIAAASLICVAGPAWWITPFGVAAMIGLFGYLLWTGLAGVTLIVRASRMRTPVAVS